MSGSHWAKVQYDDGGDFVTTKVWISRAECKTCRVGTRVLVAYLPGHPTSARRPAEHGRGMGAAAGHELSAGEEERLRRLAR